jgi:hypothetical protein
MMSCNLPDYNAPRAAISRVFISNKICWAIPLEKAATRRRSASMFVDPSGFQRSPNEELRHPIGKFVKVDGFPHPRCTFQHWRVSLMTAVAGDQNKRHFVAQELIGNRR